MESNLNRLKRTLKERMKKAWAPTLVVLVLVFANSTLFGQENLLIGPFMTLTFLKLQNDESRLGCLMKNTAIYFVMAVLAYLSMINLPLCLAANGAALLWIGMVLMNRYKPANYIPYGLALVFYQMAPVPSNGLPDRFLSIIFSAAVVYIALILITRRRPVTRLCELVSEGLRHSAELFEVIISGAPDKWEKAELEINNLNETNHKLSSEIFMHNRSAFFKYSSAPYYFPFVIVFGHFVSMGEELAKEGFLPEAADKKCLGDVCRAIRGAAGAVSNSEKASSAEALRILSSECILKDIQLKTNFEYILGFLANALSEILAAEGETNRPTPQKWKNPRHENQAAIDRHRLTIDSFRVRFGLRITITMLPAFAFAFIRGYENAYWLPMSLFLLVLPIYDNTTKRIRDRVIGTMLGLIACFAAFSIFPSETAHRIVNILANFLIYASNSYTAAVTFTTCVVLSINQVPDTYRLLTERMLYTAVSAAAALLSNRFIFPTTHHDEFKTSLSRLMLIDYEMTQELGNIKEGRDDTYLIRELILRSQLVSDKLQEHWNEAGKTGGISLADSTGKGYEGFDLKAFLRLNNRFVTGITHVYALLAERKPEGLYREEINHHLTNLSWALEHARLSAKGMDNSNTSYYKRGIYNSGIEIILREDPYLNRHLYNCELYVEEMLDMLKREDIKKA
ncbi:MAG: hypothetical protein HGA22_05225 [Clostridiales bacterium]|nr:hypothetical protein [Clostridiales bacterium]